VDHLTKPENVYYHLFAMGTPGKQTPNYSIGLYVPCFFRFEDGSRKGMR